MDQRENMGLIKKQTKMKALYRCAASSSTAWTSQLLKPQSKGSVDEASGIYSSLRPISWSFFVLWGIGIN